MTDEKESIFDLLRKSDKSAKSEKTCPFVIAHLASKSVYCIISGKACSETLPENWTSPNTCKIHAEAFRMGLETLIERDGPATGRFVTYSHRYGVREHVRVARSLSPDLEDALRREWQNIPEEYERELRNLAQRERDGLARQSLIDMTGMTEQRAREAVENLIQGEDRDDSLHGNPGVRVRLNASPVPREQFWRAPIRIGKGGIIAAIICCSLALIISGGAAIYVTTWMLAPTALLSYALRLLVRAYR